jgi:ribonuclease P protein component
MNSTSRDADSRSLAGSRLRKHADYVRAYAAARKRQSASMSWFLAPRTPMCSAPGVVGAVGSPQPHLGARVGLTAGKVLGKAVDRNRIKRRMKEALRRHVNLLPEGFDLIFHPRRVVLTLDFVQLEAEIVRILEQARVQAQAATEADRTARTPAVATLPRVRPAS